MKERERKQQPPATEWTGERILADFQKVNGIDVYALADAHNAAIKAEREVKIKDGLESDEIIAQLTQQLAAEREINQITQIGLKNGEASLREVQKQLLAAQAAIAEHNRLNWNSCDVIEVDLSALDKHDEDKNFKIAHLNSVVRDWQDFGQKLSKFLNGVTTDEWLESAKKLAEVRKPLVDALEKILGVHGNDSIKMMLEVKAICRDALAKVKEKS